MRAQVLRQSGSEVKLEDVPTPRAGPGEALVKVEACGVGLTVMNYMRNLMGAADRLPRIPGHEAVGRVVELGPGTTGLAVGQRVMAYFYLSCGACDLCRAAHEPLCRQLRGNVGVDCDGGYAEYVALPAFNLLPVPEALGAVEATAVIDAIATPLHVSRRAGVGPGDVVMVVGAGGGVGIHMVQMARLFGAEVIGVDLGAAKLSAARDVGASAVVDFGAGDVAAAVSAAAPRGVDVAVDLVGSRETLGFALDRLDRRGRLIVLTTFAGVNAEVPPRAMVRGELSILGSRYASRGEVAEAARLVAAGRIKPIVSQVVPLARVNELHAALLSRTLIGRGAITC
jgi:propanol-preferring alcohol dehydrogenase